jgi:hypothetical protein
MRKQAAGDDNIPEGFDESEMDEVQPLSSLDLKEILKHHNVGAFVNWVFHYGHRNDVAWYPWLSEHGSGSLLKILEDPELAVLYQSLLDAAAAEIGKRLQTHKIPYPLCRSVLSGYRIKVPFTLLSNYPIDDILDEYFGMIYHPDRSKELGPIEGLERLIKQKVPDVATILTSKDPWVIGGMQVTGGVLGALSPIYGREAVISAHNKYGDNPEWENYNVTFEGEF